MSLARSLFIHLWCDDDLMCLQWRHIRCRLSWQLWVHTMYYFLCLFTSREEWNENLVLLSSSALVSLTFLRRSFLTGKAFFLVIRLLLWLSWDSEDEEEECNTGCEIPVQPTHFAAPKTLDNVQQAKAAAVPKETSRDTQWCVKLWKTWTKKRNAQTIEKISPLWLTMLHNNIYLFSS